MSSSIVDKYCSNLSMSVKSQVVFDVAPPQNLLIFTYTQHLLAASVTLPAGSQHLAKVNMHVAHYPSIVELVNTFKQIISHPQIIRTVQC